MDQVRKLYFSNYAYSYSISEGKGHASGSLFSQLLEEIYRYKIDSDQSSVLMCIVFKMVVVLELIDMIDMLSLLSHLNLMRRVRHRSSLDVVLTNASLPDS